MKREELRKVEFRHSMDGGFSFNTYTGYFHMWGLECINTIGNNGQDISTNYTVAIIEEEDGSVTTIEPSGIKFIL